MGSRRAGPIPFAPQRNYSPVPDSLWGYASLKAENKEHESRERGKEKREEPQPDVFPSHPRLVDHPDEDPHEKSGIVQGHPAGGMYLQAAGIVRRSLEEKDPQ